MATITANISADATILPVSAAVDIGHYTIDTEAIEVLGNSRGPDGRAFRRLFASVNRGVAGTTAATHTSGATLTRYYPDAASAGGGGGGVTVDNTVDAPFEASTLIAPGATETAPDEATLPVSVLSRTTALTNAQLIALPTTPVTVVPAPGADKMLLLVAAILRVDTSQNGYDNFDPNGDLLLHPEGEISAPHALLLSQQMEDLLSAFDNVAVLLHPYTVANTTTGDAGAYLMPGTFSVADTSNKAMQLSVNNQALGNFTDGNAANTGSVTVVYTIVTL